MRTVSALLPYIADTHGSFSIGMQMQIFSMLNFLIFLIYLEPFPYTVSSFTLVIKLKLLACNILFQSERETQRFPGKTLSDFFLILSNMNKRVNNCTDDFLVWVFIFNFLVQPLMRMMIKFLYITNASSPAFMSLIYNYSTIAI